jgi:thiol:disulfide interchange protein DsbD
MKPRASAKPEKHDDPEYLYHHDPITWSFDLTVPEDAENKIYDLAGLIGFQTCTHTGCDGPGGIQFSAAVPVGSAMGPIPVKFTGGSSYSAVEKAIEASVNKTVPANQKAADVSPTGRVLNDSPERIAEMATYYDPNEKVKYLTLGELEDNPIGTRAENLVRRPKTTVWTALLGAFIGGILLNLMPCVFPVLGLKVMGFVEQAGSDPRKIRMHGIAFTLGLVVSMWILAAVILVMKLSFGQDVNWGAQMGNPYFVVSIIVLLFLLGLNMAGVFEIGTSLTRVGGNVHPHKGYTSSFFSGILTTLIATPCSGPFLGAAMGYTLAQPAAKAMFLFTIFALGIAFPYLLLSFFPSLINKLPRPGAWMETFKVTMAFALFATVAFFMQAFGGQTGVDGLSWLAMALVVLGLAAFFYGTWSPPHVKAFKRRWFGFVLPALIAMTGGWMALDAANYRSAESTTVAHHAGGLDWQNWTPGKIEYILEKKKKIVWVDYTADW